MKKQLEAKRSSRNTARVPAGKVDGLNSLLANLRSVIQKSRQQALRAVDVIQVRTCWLVGRHIVEFEQGGAGRAAYGRRLLTEISVRLTAEFGRGFDASNLRYMRLFYQAFPNCDALRHELSWTHYRLLLRVDDATTRVWYMNETADQNWNTRALDRQIGTLYYERLLASKDHQPVRDEAAEKTAALQASPREFIRDPVLLEFLGLPGTGKLLESKLEDALLDNLQSFLLELGKDHTVVRYSVLHDHAQLFASKYRLVLPSEEELRSELIREQEMLAGQIETGPPTPRRKPAPKRRKPKGGQP